MTSCQCWSWGGGRAGRGEGGWWPEAGGGEREDGGLDPARVREGAAANLQAQVSAGICQLNADECGHVNVNIPVTATAATAAQASDIIHGSFRQSS